MLTRIEIDGFKNLLGFSAEFGPFTCIAGPNAVGKSNLFDAIEFMSLLAEHPLKDAAKAIRGGSEIRDLFWTDGKQRLERMKLAVEVVVPTDADFRLCRYELTLGFEESPTIPGVRRLMLLHEVLRDAEETPPRFLGFEQLEPKLSAKHGKRYGYSQSAATADQTMLSRPDNDGSARSMLRNEMISWRRLALEPEHLRLASSVDDIEEQLSATGKHLPATIYRLAHQSHDGHPPDPESFYAQLAVRLSDLVNLRHIEIDRDDKHGLVSLEAKDAAGGRFPARALSDGTLRFLALATLSFARDQRLLCIEEPENGIHPGHVPELVELIRDLATDLSSDLQCETALRQVIVNTHSSEFVTAVYEAAPEDILIATEAVVPSPSGAPTTSLRLSPLVGTWRCSEQNPGVGPLPLVDYLGQGVMRGK